MATIPTVNQVDPADVLRAQVYNDEIKGSFDFLKNKPRCFTFQDVVTTDLTGSPSWKPIAWDGERLDTDNMHSTTVNSSRITIQTPGQYEILAQLHFSGTASGMRGARLTNGMTEIAYAALTPGHGATVVQVSAFDYCQAGDYLQLWGTQNSGGNQTTLNGVGHTFMSVRWVGTL